MTEKGTRLLLTGERVPEYEEQFALKAIETHCPRKWVFLDMETGDTYSYDVVKKTWVSPTPLIETSLRAFISVLVDRLRG